MARPPSSYLVHPQPGHTSCFSINQLPDYALVSGGGLNTSEVIIRYFSELEVVVDSQRKKFGGARVLLDLNGALVNPAEIALQIGALSGALFRDRDRVAVVNATALLKLQAKRVTLPHHEIFEDEASAKKWLTGPYSGA